MIHINALYDLMNHTYADFIIRGKKKLHDHGYESFNTFAHMIEHDAKFIVRIKDIDSNGILSSYDLPNGEFDEFICTTLRKRHTKLTKGNSDIYTILQPITDFDYMNEENLYYDIEFCMVRFMTADGNMSVLQQTCQRMNSL